MRSRFVFLLTIALMGLLILFVTTPGLNIIQLDVGAESLSKLLRIFFGLVGLIILHISRKGLFDYIDLSTFVNKSLESSTGAGLVFLGVCIAMLSISFMFGIFMFAF